MSEVIYDNSEYAYGAVGGIVGNNYGGNLLSCSNQGIVKGNAAQLGGIAGSSKGNITNCNNLGQIQNKNQKSTFNAAGTGGISGSNERGTVTNCNNTGQINIEGIGNVGGIIGNNVGGTISNCNNEKAIIANGSIGGIAGYNWSNGHIENCINKGDISGRTASVGGIVGQIYKATTYYCTSYGNINGNMYVLNGYYNDISAGGISGYISYGGEIFGCYNYGDITVKSEVGNSMDTGGIVGKCWSIDDEIKIENCQNEGNIKVESVYEDNFKVYNGGIIGRTSATSGEVLINKCNNLGKIEGYGTYVGGISGWNDTSSNLASKNNIAGTIIIDKCSNKANLSAQSEAKYVSVGGITGQNYAYYGPIQIINSYNTGSISGSSKDAYYLGGIIGYNYAGGNRTDIEETENIKAIVFNCYNIGQVLNKGISETECSGGVVGKNMLKEGSIGTAEVTNCYYLTNCITNEFVYNNATCQTAKKSDQEMKDKNFVTLLNNNTSVWSYDNANVNNGYPILDFGLKEISITNLPAKLEYKEGESFDTTGMTVLAIYKDDISKNVTDYSVIDGENLTPEQTSVTIRYTENGIEKEATQEITVVAKTLIGIEVKTQPSDTNYFVGETLNTGGLVLTATYDNGDTEEITEGYSCTPTTLNIAGTQTITVTYEGKTATYNVTVVAKTLTGIEITNTPTKIEYVEGQVFDDTGMVVTATYDNGTSGVVEEYTINPEGALTREDTKIIISYTEKGVTKTAEVNITVMKKGDVNRDNVVDFMDILAINKHRLGKIQLTGRDSEAADVNEDGIIDFIDILQINKYRLGKINSL